MSKASHDNHRRIVERLYVRGTLTLLTPTYLGNGDNDPSVDLPLLTDPLTGCALLTGASLAGALRGYLLSCVGEEAQVAKLLGGARQNDDGEQSALIVEDALATAQVEPELVIRDGVRLERESRTAADTAKYDLELLAAGTRFDLSFELIIRETDNAEELKQLLATALAGLAGEIHLGGRKRRGYGQCEVTDWQVVSYKLDTAVGLLGWLQHPRQFSAKTGLELLGKPLASQRHQLTIEATFEIATSVLIRTEPASPLGPDHVHLSGKVRGQDGLWEKNRPILSGTSLAGALRAQAGRIARTLDKSDKFSRSEELLNKLFGQMLENNNYQATASRVAVREVPIEEGEAWVQSRVAIDRFTGGALETALFAEQPHFGGRFTLHLSVRRPSKAQMGLLFFVLRDWWTGFSPIGGEVSVGRGRLQGHKATITYEEPAQPKMVAVIEQKGEALAVENGKFLEDCVTALHTYVQEVTTHGTA